jgi:hypothetical protein
MGQGPQMVSWGNGVEASGFKIRGSSLSSCIPAICWLNTLSRYPIYVLCFTVVIKWEELNCIGLGLFVKWCWISRFSYQKVGYIINTVALELIQDAICRTLGFKLQALIFFVQTLTHKKQKPKEKFQQGHTRVTRIGRCTCCVFGNSALHPVVHRMCCLMSED